MGKKAGRTVKDDPPPCDPEIFEKGTEIASLDAGKLAMEGLIDEVRRGGWRVDWHYCGGRAKVLTLDDSKNVRKILESAIPRLLT